jgi:hypothetical protein
MKRFCIVTIAALGLFALSVAGFAAKKANHHNGKQLIGEKIKHDGQHVLGKKGPFTTTVEVRNGKVAGLHVKHDKKGDVPVTKYKTDKKMAFLNGHPSPFRLAAFEQDEYLGTTYIGYAYTDDDGYEEIYWFPYDMILDGDTGAVMYIPAG